MAITTSRPACRPARAARFLASTLTLLGVLPATLPALEARDPFDTRALTPPRPALDLSATASGYLPCQALPDNAVYGVVEVIDLDF